MDDTKNAQRLAVAAAAKALTERRVGGVSGELIARIVGSLRTVLTGPEALRAVVRAQGRPDDPVLVGELGRLITHAFQQHRWFAAELMAWLGLMQDEAAFQQWARDEATRR